MTRSSICRILVAASVGLLRAVTAAEPAEFHFTGQVLTIHTERYVVTWENGCMRALTNLLGVRRDLTVPGIRMTPQQLPNGMGSFHGQRQAGADQHFPIHNVDLTKKQPTFFAQHPAGPETRVTCRQMADGVRLTYAGLERDPTARLTQELTVARDTGELVIRQTAESEHPGVFGVSFSLLDLRPDIGFAVPYFGGQRFGADIGRDRLISCAWPQFWSAGVLIGEVPEGGSFVVFADDRRLRAKYFMLHNTNEAQGLSFESCTDAPYEERRRADVCAWRFNTFAGGWVQPAARYRQWLINTYQLVPISERDSHWMDDIALAWPTGISTDALRIMSARIEPSKVLIVDLGWAQGFNRNCPYYEPRNADLAGAVAAAHEYGYRYGVYVGEKLVDRHAHPELFSEYGLRIAFDALSQDEAKLDAIRTAEEAVQRKETSGHFLASVHPGSDRWIEFYANLMVDYHSKYGIDMFYQDVSGAHPGSSGLLDGRTLHEGTIACERRIREKLPHVALAGEFWNEVNLACGQDMGLQNFMSWLGEGHNKRLARHPHPLMGLLFDGLCRYMSYKTPVRSGAKFHRDQNTLEVMGALPTWRTHVTDDGGEARLVMERAKLFVDGFRPYYPEEWAAGDVAYMRAADGRVVRYERKDRSTYCYENDGNRERLRYGRATGVERVALDEPVVIDGWGAYSDDGPIGLDPQHWYCVFPGNPEQMPVRLVALPPHATVLQTRMAEQYALFSLSSETGGRAEWRVEDSKVQLAQTNGVKQTGPVQALLEPGAAMLFVRGSLSPAAVDAPLPLETWDIRQVAHGLVIAKTDWTYPPRDWKLGEQTLRGYGVFPITGGKGAETTVDGRIRLPDETRIALHFSMGRLGGKGDGVHYVVRVNGTEIWRGFSEPERRGWIPVTVALGEFAGQDVLLSLALDCGPSGFNTSNDQSLWGDPKLVLSSNAGTGEREQ